jgi:hypothetical protein
MGQRDLIYLLANSIAPVLAIAGIFSFVVGSFNVAWVCVLGIVLCMETRVQAGERLPRTTLFRVHLLSSVPLFILLTILAFFAGGTLLELLTILFGLTAFYTGAILWYRGMQARMLHLR